MKSGTQYVHHADTRPLWPNDLETVLEHVDRESERAAIRWRVLLTGPNTAFLIDGQVVAAGGFQLMHLGVADPWLAVTPEGRKHFRPLYRAIVAWLLEQRQAYGLHRLQAGVRYDDVRGRRLLEHLGMECEGMARQFGPDRADYYYYAWVRRD